jgi:hypothetical protein
MWHGHSCLCSFVLAVGVVASKAEKPPQTHRQGCPCYLAATTRESVWDFL